MQLIVNKICQRLESNRGSPESEATALPTEPLPMPYFVESSPQESGRVELVSAHQGGLLEEGVFWAAKHVFRNFLPKGKNRWDFRELLFDLGQLQMGRNDISGDFWDFGNFLNKIRHVFGNMRVILCFLSKWLDVKSKYNMFMWRVRLTMVGR